MPLSAGNRLGPYEILALVGRGGMGAVYKARDTKLNRPVAVKLLSDEVADIAGRRRFQREAQMASSLNHPHIVTVHDAGEFEGQQYLVTEFVDGGTLKDWARAQRRPWWQITELLTGVADGLASAHAAGITHRDIKPANILVTASGYAKLADFGLAKLVDPLSVEGPTLTLIEDTRPGVVVGTVAYMSPEQASGKPVDARSDIFSFGIVLHELLAGRRPFEAKTDLELLQVIIHSAPQPLDREIPESLRNVVEKALEKDPADRYQTMREMVVDLRRLSRHKPDVTAPSAEAPTPAVRQTSIAVLPFANMSADKENEFFGDGLAEEVINVLAQAPGMKVAGRTSSFFFRGKDVEFTEIGNRLNVDHILEGSVRKAGNRIRVTAQLINVNDGFHLWSERYERELTDIFAIQDEITQAIAAALRVKLSPQTNAPKRYVPNLRAYEAYLKARDLWIRGTPDALERVKELVEQAIALDPQFGLARFLLAAQYTMLANVGIREGTEMVPLARAAAEDAVRTDPSLPEARAILACCDDMDYQWTEAEHHWQLTLACETVSREVRLWYGNHHLVSLGRSVEALENIEPALDEDPLNHLYRYILANALWHSGRLDEAIGELRKILEVEESYGPAVFLLSAIRGQQGFPEESLRLSETAYGLMPWSSPLIGQFAALLARAGAPDRAKALIDELKSGQVCGAPAGLAAFHGLLGELDQAAEYAERAIDERYPKFIHILRPLFQHTPQWPALARRMRLPA
jgi:serine/threonine-protein kinase